VLASSSNRSALMEALLSHARKGDDLPELAAGFPGRGLPLLAAARIVWVGVRPLGGAEQGGRRPAGDARDHHPEEPPPGGPGRQRSREFVEPVGALIVGLPEVGATPTLRQWGRR